MKNGIIRMNSDYSFQSGRSKAVTQRARPNHLPQAFPVTRMRRTYIFNYCATSREAALLKLPAQNKRMTDVPSLKSVCVSYLERNKILKVPSDTDSTTDLEFLEREFRREFLFDQDADNIGLTVTFQRYEPEWEEYIWTGMLQ